MGCFKEIEGIENSCEFINLGLFSLNFKKI